MEPAYHAAGSGINPVLTMTVEYGPMAYLGENIDAASAAVTAEGGKVSMPVSESPVGRIAMVADPQGVPSYSMTPVPPPGQENAKSDVFSPTAEQRVGWNESASPDSEASKAFYARHF
ncbi:hypothetical protein OY671_009301, partial [Metschnikowia pulcherrima]